MCQLALDAEQDSDPEARPKPAHKPHKSATAARQAMKNSFEVLTVDVEDASDQNDADFTSSHGETGSSSSDLDSDSGVEEITNAEVHTYHLYQLAIANTFRSIQLAASLASKTVHEHRKGKQTCAKTSHKHKCKTAAAPSGASKRCQVTTEEVTDNDDDIPPLVSGSSSTVNLSQSSSSSSLQVSKVQSVVTSSMNCF